MSRFWLALSFMLLSPLLGTAGDWPQFRGPTQQGVSTEIKLPVTWSETEHIAWKTDLPGLGWSSPSIAGKQIWVTTAVDDGHSLRAMCLDRDSGRITKDVEVFHKDEPGPVHQKNSHASPTPLIEGDRVYVHFGKLGTACLTTKGDIVWQTELIYEHRHGPGGSPVVFENLLILNCDGTDTQYVIALDKTTGKEVWKQFRGEASMAYSTPTLTVVDGRAVVISCGGEWTVAYEPTTGKELWRFRYPKGYSNVPRPVVGFGMAFVSSGFNTPTLYALKLDGAGDLTNDHVAWKMTKGAPRNASPLVAGDEFYMVSDNGIVTCLDAKTGEQHWQERVGGDCSASPLFADGRLYITNETGVTTVLAAGKTHQELAKNELPGRTLASLATADGAIFLRTDAALYRIDSK
ncbi:MAG: PQQ-binding-like beta-propeller repeat protein [Planctomycetaceae bacterium]|nr:PQQ-binding-like beta-propeller repeat protein [Planctomycetaceae bacterium]